MNDRIRCYINNKPRQIISAVVEKNGTRAIDNADVTLPRNVAVDKGDVLTYIQDVVTTKYLTGFWNFMNSTRDESGYDLDGSEASGVETDASYQDGCDGKIINFSSGSPSRGVRIDNNSHIDFAGQFDIIIWCNIPFASSNKSAGYLFSKGDSNNYIKISHTAVNSNVSYAKLELRINGGTAVSITGSNVDIAENSTLDSSAFHFIRVKRDENDLVTLAVDGTTEGTATASGNINTGSTYLYLGADQSGANLPYAKIANIRFYSGSYLSDDDYTKVRQSRRMPNVMKFGGVVWKIDEKPAFKRVLVHGFAKIIHDASIDTEGTTATPTWTTGDDNINKNIYYGKTGIEIITDLCKAFNTGIKVVDVDGNVNQNYTHYTAKGSVFTNLVILVTNGSGDSSFSIDARKVLRLEDDDIDYYSGGGTVAGNGTISSYNHNKFSPITFKQGVIKVKDLGIDTSSAVTYLTAITGDIKTYQKTETKNSGDFNLESSSQTGTTRTNYTCTVQRKPVDDARRLTVVHSSGGTDTTLTYTPMTFNTPTGDNEEFTVDSERKYIILGNTASSGTYTITYDYEDFSSKNYIYRRGGDFANIGQLNRTIYVPQLKDSGGSSNLSNFCTRFLSKNGYANRRISISSPTLINHIRENYKVKVIDTTHGISTSQNVSVRSMVYEYPTGITHVNLGDHVFDAYDLDKVYGDAIYELRNQFTKTQPA